MTHLWEPVTLAQLKSSKHVNATLSVRQAHAGDHTATSWIHYSSHNYTVGTRGNYRLTHATTTSRLPVCLLAPPTGEERNALGLQITGEEVHIKRDFRFELFSKTHLHLQILLKTKISGYWTFVAALSRRSRISCAAVARLPLSWGEKTGVTIPKINRNYPL